MLDRRSSGQYDGATLPRAFLWYPGNSFCDAGRSNANAKFWPQAVMNEFNKSTTS